MQFSELLAAATMEGDVLRCPGSENWGQGRTMFGGMGAAISFERIRREHDSLPPLRSAQIAYIGPAAGELMVEAKVLRQGKSTTFVDTTLLAEGRIASKGQFVFGASRESTVQVSDNPAPQVPHYTDLEASGPHPFQPPFFRYFEVLVASGGMVGAGQSTSELTWWARHVDQAAYGTESGLLCIGDLLPPAVGQMMKTLAPMSSVNWQIDIFGDDLSTEDGWYLIQNRAQWGGGGWSAQDMNVWSSDGRPIAGGRQTVVVFS